ncbi:MAG: TonB-dependent receptor [Pseudomonadales bacterium]|nr:TonB-dependent receptor [Pseudomonadales bacterium]
MKNNKKCSISMMGALASITILMADSGLYAATSGQENLSTVILEEVIVTSRKREERLQETPIAITAFSSNDLEMLSLNDLSGIGSFTPNLVFDQGTGNTGGSTSSQIYMRGIGQADFLFTSEPGVGIYLDGVYLPRSIGSLMDLIDIERVEVLKGPQGTLFGKNSVGGAISIVSKRPDNEFAGDLQLTLGEFSRREFSGNVNMPIVADKLLSKLSFSWKDVDGHTRRIQDNTRLGGTESFATRGQLEWLASDTLEVFFAADYTRKRDDSIANTLLAVDDTNASLLQLWNALVAPSGTGGLYDSRFISSDPFTSQGTGPNISDLDLWGVSTTVTWNNDNLSVKSITSYRDQDAFFGADTDHSPLTYFEQTVTDNQKQFSQEIQVSGEALDERLNWLVGAMYFNEKGDNQYRIIFAPGLFDVLETLPAGAILGIFGGAGNPANALLDFDGQVNTDIENDSYSAFVHGTYKFTDQLSMTAGGRFTQEEKEFRGNLQRFSAGVTTVDADVSESWNAFTPKIGLEYLWTPEIMTYISAARGFKSGGFNGRPTEQLAAETPFDPEYVWTYEIGLKSSLLNRRVILNSAVFYSDYTDLQLLSVTVDSNGGIVALTQNAGKAEISGFEIEATALLSNTLKVNLGVGYLDAEYTDLDATVTGVTEESDLVKAPQWTTNIGAEWDLLLGNFGSLIAKIDYAYQSRVEHVSNNIDLLSQKEYGLLSARLVLVPDAADWNLAIYGRNLTDELYITNGLSQLDSLGTVDASYGRPREVGVQFKLSF